VDMEIEFLQAGGTIDKDYPHATRGYGFEIGHPAVTTILEQFNPDVHWHVTTVMRKDSQDMTDDDRSHLCTVCQDATSARVVITHGTDTLLDTARMLVERVVGKTIVLTGATRPAKFADSDAVFNIATAIGAMNLLEEGVYVAMNGRVMPARDCVRDARTGHFMQTAAEPTTVEEASKRPGHDHRTCPGSSGGWTRMARNAGRGAVAGDFAVAVGR
jgi:L-asparaginase